MESDNGSHNSPAVVALFNDYVKMVIRDDFGPEEREYKFFRLRARPKHYVLAYKFAWWQKVLWPIRAAKIISGRRRLKGIAQLADNDMSIQRLEHELRYIEFGAIPLNAEQRTEIRTQILAKNIGQRDVRNAFRSLALWWWPKKSIHQIQQPALAYWLGKLGRNVFAVLIGASLAAALWAMQSEACQTCTWVGYFVLAECLTFPFMFCHLVGPSWTQAQHTLGLLPSLRNDIEHSP